MNAIVSGQARTALLIDGDTLFSFDIDTPEIPRPRRESDFRFLFGEATDLRFIRDAKQEDVLKELRADYEKTCALDLALMLLDEDISRTKPLIGEALEELLTEKNIIIYLDSIFYAKPLPTSADTGNALRVCEDVFPKTYNWLSNLINKQEDIIWVRDIWDKISTDVFGDEEKRADFQKVIIHQGIFRELVLHCHDNSKISSINFNVRTNKLITSLPNHRNVLQALFAPFSQSPRVSQEQKRLLKNEEDEVVSPRQKGRQRIDGESVKNKVQATIDYITIVLKERNLALAQKLTDELIAFQLKNGKPIHLVKSLCQLAQNAKDCGFYEFQLELTEQAKNLEYSDAWTQAQYGDALLRNNRFDEAVNAFNNAISFYKIGDNKDTHIVARNGYAEILKAQGKLDEALKIYQETMKSHPEDVVTKRGYAEILKAQGKLDEALKIYQEVINSHPEDAFSRNGLCGVLFALRRYDEALEKLPNDDFVTLGDWIGYHIRGMIMLRKGNLTEAVRIFEKGEKEDPIPSSKEYFRSALAIAHLRQGEFKQAGELLNKVTTPLLQPAINLLRVHAFGEQKMYLQAEAAFLAYKNAPISKIIAGYRRQNTLELASEFESRYVTSRIPHKSEDWVIDREEELLLALAP